MCYINPLVSLFDDSANIHSYMYTCTHVHTHFIYFGCSAADSCILICMLVITPIYKYKHELKLHLLHCLLQTCDKQSFKISLS